MRVICKNCKVQARGFDLFTKLARAAIWSFVHVQFQLRTSAWMSTSMNGELLKGSNVLKTISSTRLHYWALQNDPSSCNNCLTAIIFKMCNSQCIENVSTSVLNHVCTVDNWHFAFLTLHLHSQMLLTSNTGVPQYKNCQISNTGLPQTKNCQTSNTGVPQYKNCQTSNTRVPQYKNCHRTYMVSFLDGWGLDRKYSPRPNLIFRQNFCSQRENKSATIFDNCLMWTLFWCSLGLFADYFWFAYHNMLRIKLNFYSK